MNTKECMTQSDDALLHVYNRYPIVFEKGEGVYLYDTDGKRYLDAAAGIGVMAYGYGNPEYTQSITSQAEKLLHTSNLFYNLPMSEAAERLKKASGMDRVFFTNSGTEAVEGALKAAKKYAFLRDGTTDHEIIAMNNSFHGRSLGALSVTGTAHYREPFEGLIPGIRFADFNDIDSVLALVNEKTCAVILEPLQGEGGIFPATEEFIAGLKKLQQERDILLIFDEVQCGMGRTGKMFAYQHYDVHPDILTSAKALGCGVPVGAFLLTGRVAERSLVPGDHGSTYGGNPFVCSAVSKVLEMMERDDLPGHVTRVGAYLEEKLDALAARYDFIVCRRGMGLMQGLELSVQPGKAVSKAQELGLIVITAGSNVLRLLPPLIYEEEHVDELVSILDRVFASLQE